MIEVSRIQSHSEPRRYLKQHVAEIVAASDALLAQHGPAPWRALGGESLAVDLARLHDLGKGSASFQAYIADPDGWTGDPRRKAHSLLSLVLATIWAESVELDARGLIARALAVVGHHGGQPSDEDSLAGKLTESEWREALCAELPTLDPSALAAETGLEPLLLVGEPNSAVRRVKRTLHRALEGWRALANGEMVRARFVARAAYSVLLEADKAFLAVERPKNRARPAISPTRVDDLKLDTTPMDDLRVRARADARAGFDRQADEPLLRLTLPTGAGKTLIAARWALAERERQGNTSIDAPTVIVALPMLSIVDQTEKVWRLVLGANEDDSDKLLPFHSLSERNYDHEDLRPRGTADFFIDTWRSEVVVTTFDQLLLALYSDRAKHAMRFHRLLNARIVMDEVQCIPPVLWTAVSQALGAITSLGRTRVLTMSATPSPCIEGAAEVLENPEALYAGLARYELRLEHESALSFDAFIAMVKTRCETGLARGEGTLVTVNVRATAQETWERLKGLDPLLLSGDLTPEHRLRVIAELKDDPRRVVVSTQCVEAGVDLDMHNIIRDLAPLDALVQIAGRCNRHATRSEPGLVTVVHLRNLDGRDDAQTIYDCILLQCTREVLQGRPVVPEREVLGLCNDWFQRVADRKYQGDDDFRKWARIEKRLDVRELLRGEELDQRQVLVTEHDPSLRPALLAALGVRDRWERRSALRSLSARLARQTVSLAPKVFEALSPRPRPIDSLGMWHELGPGQYGPVRGIDSRMRA